MQLGAPKGRRYEWQGLLRRDFERGFVLVNQPGAKHRHRERSGDGAHGPAGEPRRPSSLSAAEGAVVTTGGGSPARPAIVRTRTRVRSVPNPRLRPAIARRAVSVKRKPRRGMLASGRLRRAVLVYGRVSRAPARAGVVLRLQRRSAKGWIAVRTAHASPEPSRPLPRLFRGLRPAATASWPLPGHGKGTAPLARPTRRRFAMRR